MRRTGRAVVLVVALVGCTHSEPFTSHRYPPGGPYDAGTPRRLTFDLGVDATPAWVPDESGVLYSFERLDRPDHDRCLGQLPATGGTRTLSICNISAPGDDSTDVLISPALSLGGRLAYFRSAATLFPQRPTSVAILVGTLAAPAAGPVLQDLPRSFTAGYAETVEQIRWLSDTDFVYLPVSLPALFEPTRPLAIVRVRLRGDSAAYEVLANTDTASSVAAVGADTMYYTVRGDTRVFERVLSTGVTTVAHDFGAGASPRAVQVAGARLAAIIANDVWLVNLTDGTETLVPTSGPVLDHALAPSGTRLAAVIVDGGNVDLWLIDLP